MMELSTAEHAGPVAAPPAVDRAAAVASWRPMIEAALAGEGLRIHHQPIVDLQRGTVVGYECLARFAGPPTSPPNVWFAVAHELGLGVELEAAAVRLALAGREQLPPNCFLSVNLAPELLFDERMTTVLDAAGRLGGVVLELTEHTAVSDLRALRAALDRQRDAGALIAIDDAGAGYAGLQWLMSLAPEIVKLDRELVAGVHRDEVRRALVETLGTFANRIDAWILAEGIEEPAELHALVQLGVPLGQGYLLGRPADGWPTCATEVAAPRASTEADHELVASLVETADEAAEAARRAGGAMRVKLTESISEVLLRAVTRSADERWQPLLAVDALGRPCGTVRMERLIHAALVNLQRSTP